MQPKYHTSSSSSSSPRCNHNCLCNKPFSVFCTIFRTLATSSLYRKRGFSSYGVSLTFLFFFGSFWYPQSCTPLRGMKQVMPFLARLAQIFKFQNSDTKVVQQSIFSSLQCNGTVDVVSYLAWCHLFSVCGVQGWIHPQCYTYTTAVPLFFCIINRILRTIYPTTLGGFSVQPL